MTHSMKRTAAPRWLLAGLLVTALPSAASAHFVWVEPAPNAGAVRVCFGEYPNVREGKELLEKVQRVKLFTLDGKSRRELKAEAGDDHYLYPAQGGAPVTVAALDYGILQRGDTPAFLLRYESQLLGAPGQALALPEIARLSGIETGLRLGVGLKPAGPHALALQVKLDGKPVAAEVSHLAPKESEMKKAQTGTDGKFELPVAAPGIYHLRIKAEDARPATFEGKEGKFTRTYLSLTFQVAGNPAAAVAQTAPGGADAAAATPKPDAEAVRLLHEAHVARANYPADFPGFTADAVFSANGKTAKGKITVDREFNITYALGDKELENTLRPSFGSLIMHRRAGSEGGAPEYPATWRDAQTHPLGRAINLNDKHGSFYRVRDRQIMQVNRNMGKQRFTTNVIENEETKHGFLPRSWTVAYYENDTNAMTRVSTTRVTWAWKGELFLPATLDTIVAHPEGTDVTKLVLSNFQLLK